VTKLNDRALANFYLFIKCGRNPVGEEFGDRNGQDQLGEESRRGFKIKFSGKPLVQSNIIYARLDGSWLLKGLHKKSSGKYFISVSISGVTKSFCGEKF